MTGKFNIFIVTKPLQYIVARLVARQLEIADSSQFVIVDSGNWVGHLQWLLSEDGLDKFIVNDTKVAYKYIKTLKNVNLYIDSDVGVKKHFTLLLLRFVGYVRFVKVYEEGVGTYRSDLYSGLKKKFMNKIGVGSFFGGSSMTDEVFVFEPDEYVHKNRPAAQIKKINVRVHEFIKENIEKYLLESDVLSKITLCETSKKCALYLASWDADLDFLEKLKREQVFVVCKHHPHKRNIIPTELFDIEIGGAEPAEFVIEKLLQYYPQIDVYHHGSSAERYIKSDRVRFILASKISRVNFS